MLSFPPFTLDQHRHSVTRGGEEVPLSPHLVDILGYLASRPGELVTKDTLLDRFWPDVNVTENTLTRAIADIRKALGDSSESPRFIQTVARKGYRFVGAVEAKVNAHEAGSGARTTIYRMLTEDPFRDWVRGRLSLEALDATRLPDAVAAFERAVAATPEYAPAHAGLANACFLQFEHGRAQNIPDAEPLARAIRHSRRACELDQSLGEAWATLGFVLTAAGAIEEARAAARHAAALEPTSWRHHFRLAFACWGEERLRAVDRTLALLPDFAQAHFLAAMVFVARGAFGLALEHAAAGAARQNHQSSGNTAPFPAVGLHWLHGLLLLHKNQIGPAIFAFTREIDSASDGLIYAAEFRVNAQIAAGFAHLAHQDAAGAVEAFRAALGVYPRNGRALVGLYRALSLTGFAPEAPQLIPEIERSISELTEGRRPTEAALISAALQAARHDQARACATLAELLDRTPVGHAGWLIPIDPMLAPLRSAPPFEHVLAKLAARAA